MCRSDPAGVISADDSQVNCCMQALAGGVKKTHIIDGRIPPILLEIFTDKGIGTMVAGLRPAFRLKWEEACGLKLPTFISPSLFGGVANG